MLSNEAVEELNALGPYGLNDCSAFTDPTPAFGLAPSVLAVPFDKATGGDDGAMNERDDVWDEDGVEE